MFIIEKKRKPFRTIDAVVELFAESIRQGSPRPLTLLWRKGRYGNHGCLYGTYKDYRRYCEKIKNRKEVTLTQR